MPSAQSQVLQPLVNSHSNTATGNKLAGATIAMPNGQRGMKYKSGFCSPKSAEVINWRLATSIQVKIQQQLFSLWLPRRVGVVCRSRCERQQASRLLLAALRVDLGAGLAQVLAAHSAQVALLGEACNAASKEAGRDAGREGHERARGTISPPHMPRHNTRLLQHPASRLPSWLASLWHRLALPGTAWRRLAPIPVLPTHTAGCTPCPAPPAAVPAQTPSRKTGPQSWGPSSARGGQQMRQRAGSWYTQRRQASGKGRPGRRRRQTGPTQHGNAAAAAPNRTRAAAAPTSGRPKVSVKNCSGAGGMAAGRVARRDREGARPTGQGRGRAGAIGAGGPGRTFCVGSLHMLVHMPTQPLLSR